PGLTGDDVSRYFSGPRHCGSNPWLLCSYCFSSNVKDVYHERQVTVHLYFWEGFYSEFKYSNGLIGNARELARPPRLERRTLCLEGRCSIQLSYGRYQTDYANFNQSHQPHLMA